MTPRFIAINHLLALYYENLHFLLVMVVYSLI